MTTRSAITERKDLEKEAAKQALAKGHNLSYFATGYGASKAWSEAYCLDCQMYVAVNARPNPKAINQSRIGGLALLFDCTGKEEE